MQSQTQDAAECRVILDLIKPDWLVVDHYALDAEWESAARPVGSSVMVVDDLADRQHFCEILVDQTLGRDSVDYHGLVHEGCERLVGSDFALLRSEFFEEREHSLKRRMLAKPEHLLISLGGRDQYNLTESVLDSLAEIDGLNLRITAVLGLAAPWRASVEARASSMRMPIQVLSDVTNMARLMTSADIAIGAAGTTAWERCCLGLPTLLFVLAENQVMIADALVSAGAACQIDLPSLTGFSAQMKTELLRMIAPSNLQSMSKAASKVTDGCGGGRIVDRMMQLSYRVRAASLADAEPVYRWRYAHGEANYYCSGQVPTLAEHIAWFSNAIASPDCIIYVVSRDSISLGYVRLDYLDGRVGVAEVSICLNPDHRRAGHAAPILRAALVRVARIGIEEFRAKIHEDNLASVSLFESFCFERISQSGSFILLAANASRYCA